MKSLLAGLSCVGRHIYDWSPYDIHNQRSDVLSDNLKLAESGNIYLCFQLT
ncbi:hypothetical protein EWB00_001963, partial [Schistosoma japonicum]